MTAMARRYVWSPELLRRLEESVGFGGPKTFNGRLRELVAANQALMKKGEAKIPRRVM